MTAPSWQDFYDLGVYTAQVRRPSMVVYRGDVSDAQTAGCATMATAVVGYAFGAVKATFLDGAVGEDLTAKCHDEGVDRFEGSNSIGVATISRAAATQGAGTIPAGTPLATAIDPNTGQFVTVTTDVDCIFGASDLTHVVNATCAVIDVVGNFDVGLLNRFVNLSLLWDQTLTVTNADRFAGGSPVESDEDLRDRKRQFYLTQAKGTVEALEFGAKEVPGVSRVSIVVDGSGVVNIYVADVDGNSNAAMAAAVLAEINGPPAWRDAADIVYVTAATLFQVAIDLTLTVRLGTDVNQLLDTVRAAIVVSTNRLQPGDTLFRDAISAAGKAVDPDAILSVRVNNPPVDLVPSSNQAIATTISLVTFS